jgi:hypothetical protein
MSASSCNEHAGCTDKEGIEAGEAEEETDWQEAIELLRERDRQREDTRAAPTQQARLCFCNRELGQSMTVE